MRSSELDYELPPELIAQQPARAAGRVAAARLRPRDAARRGTGASTSCRAELAEGTLVVVNDTRVLPARLRLERPGGGEAEVLLLERLGANGTWEGLARPSRKLRPGQRLGPVELLEPLGEGRWRLRLDGEPAGEAPLPPYIHEPLADPERYQTVYARERGLGRGADGRAALHAGAARAARRRAGDAARRPRHVPPARGRDAGGARAAQRALRGRARRVGADPGRRAGARGRDDDGARARVARPRRAA